MPFIADDLGATTPAVIALLNQFQIPGTRVLQFEFSSNSAAQQDLPGLHPETSVVYTGTHDNDTTAGWYEKLPATQRAALQTQLGASSQEVVWAMIRKALTSRSDTVIIPAQDLLELGSQARMNFPGIEQGNWQWRLEDGALTHEVMERLRTLTAACGRVGSSNYRRSSKLQESME